MLFLWHNTNPQTVLIGIGLQLQRDVLQLGSYQSSVIFVLGIFAVLAVTVLLSSGLYVIHSKIQISKATNLPPPYEWFFFFFFLLRLNVYINCGYSPGIVVPCSIICVHVISFPHDTILSLSLSLSRHSIVPTPPLVCIAVSYINAGSYILDPSTTFHFLSCSLFPCTLDNI